MCMAMPAGSSIRVSRCRGLIFHSMRHGMPTCIRCYSQDQCTSKRARQGFASTYDTCPGRYDETKQRCATCFVMFCVFLCGCFGVFGFFFCGCVLCFVLLFLV